MAKPVQHPHSRIHILEDVIKLGDSVIAKCDQERMLKGILFWQVAYFVRATKTARAVLSLFKVDLGTETRILIRSLYDALIDTLFIGKHYGHADRICQALEDEASEDRFRHLKSLAVQENCSVERFAEQVPRVREVIDAYNKFKTTRAFQISPKNLDIWERRWMHITAKQKLKTLPQLPRTLKSLGLTVRTMGNAFAHNRPAALRSVVYQKRDGTTGVRKAHVPVDYTDTDEFGAFAACMFLLIACDHVTSDFSLGDRLERRVKRVMEQLKVAAREYPIQKAMPRGKRRVLI